MSDDKLFYAHSANSKGDWQSMQDHLSNVASNASDFASVFESGEEARLTGLLHDIGKYGDRFQKRLHGKDHGLDHWSTGAWIALTKYSAAAAAVAIQGHHVGLQQLDVTSLRALDPVKLSHSHPLSLCLSETDINLLTQRLTADGLNPIQPISPIYAEMQQTASAMLDVRMLFSALVDADFLDTEDHFRAGEDRSKYRPTVPLLQAQQALCILNGNYSAPG